LKSEQNKLHCRCSAIFCYVLREISWLLSDVDACQFFDGSCYDQKNRNVVVFVLLSTVHHDVIVSACRCEKKCQ